LIFEQHYLECLSQASYFIGDESTGRAVVVDPRRDIAAYLETAAEHKMTIELVIETHLHADFLSGHLELADATGASIAYGAAANVDFDSVELADGDLVRLGDVVLEIRHTPGHTPESISIVVYDYADDAAAYAVLTGDTLFVGDVGRPDLLSSKGVTSKELGGRLFDSLHGQLMTLPDSTRVYPGHGAGSSCGKNLSNETWSTIGDQRVNNYALAPMTKVDFIEVVTGGQNAPPAYFSYDASLNGKVRPIFDDSPPSALSLSEVVGHRDAGAAVVDTRDPSDFAAGHLKGSVNVGLAGRYAEFVGGVVDPQQLIVLVGDDETAHEAKTRLARIGFDNVVGYLERPLIAFETNPGVVGRSSRVDVSGLELVMGERDDLQLIDIRQPRETADGVIEGALVIPLTRLNEQLDSLDASKPTVIYCAGGFRSSIAASRMKAAGFSDVSDLLGGYNAWKAVHMKVGVS